MCNFSGALQCRETREDGARPAKPKWRSLFEQIESIRYGKVGDSIVARCAVLLLGGTKTLVSLHDDVLGNSLCDELGSIVYLVKTKASVGQEFVGLYR